MLVLVLFCFCRFFNWGIPCIFNLSPSCCFTQFNLCSKCSHLLGNDVRFSHISIYSYNCIIYRIVYFLLYSFKNDIEDIVCTKNSLVLLYSFSLKMTEIQFNGIRKALLAMIVSRAKQSMTILDKNHYIVECPIQLGDCNIID